MLNTQDRVAYGQEHELFRDSVRKFFAKELVPNLMRFDAEGIVDRKFWKATGDAGLLCPGVPEEYGGMGLDFRYNAIISEELAYVGSAAGLPVQSDLCADYILHYGTEEQKQRWLPAMVAGDVIVAIAMTEPGTGSDLQAIRTSAIRDGDEYVINGSKTYITNGQNADLVILVAKTDPTAGAKGISLILVEATREGFKRGRNLDKIGQPSADTSELFFNEVRVPVTNCLGQEGKGFVCLMKQLPQERLSISVISQASAQRALDEAVNFTKDRKAFGATVFDFQNTRYELADMKAKVQVGWAHLDWALLRLVAGKLTTAEASAAKLWHSELQCEICDRSLQLHGGAGYMNEYLIARLWRDARVSRIYGGTSEIMKEVIARSL
jgi:alkylation response protein AidB-like acyl-CoA dehydrogenase